MTLPLTEEQGRAAVASTEGPLRLIDPNTNTLFVLLRAEDYERVCALVDQDFDIRETYSAQFASAMRAGWGDPAMDDYDNYDEAYRKLCQSGEAKSS